MNKGEIITGPPASTTRSTHVSTSCSLLVVTQPSDPHGKREKVREGIKRGN
jgi:hypothetical protein